MKENKNQILKALTTMHIEAIKTARISSVKGGDGCTISIDPKA